MERNLYVEALISDPIVGVMVEWILVANTSIQSLLRLSAHQEAIARTTKSAAIAALPATCCQAAEGATS